jgi:replicative DNA helicase
VLDLTLLRILKNKDHYDRIVPNLPKGALDDKTMIVLKDFGAYLKQTGHPVVKMGPFKTYFFNFRHKNLPADVAEYYAKLIDNCEKNIDAETTKLMANQLVELSFATDIANDASNYHRGDEIDIIHSVGMKHELAKANIMCGDTASLYISDNIEELLEEDENLTGLRFSLKCLREGIRPLRSGDFVLVCSRPDTGKTTFLSSELVGITDSLEEDDTVLWFNNEGEGNRIIKRLYQAFLGCNTEELIAARKEGVLLDNFRASNGHKVRIIDCHDWDTLMVEQVIAETKPKLVIFDMIDNIEFKGGMRSGHDARTDQVLEAQYQWARKLGVKYGHPVIATSQISAGVEQQADTQCWPPMHALKDSQTGKQGAADLMIMIGRSSDPMCVNDRYISTPKNKLSSGGQNYIRQAVNIDIERAKYLDPIN